MTWGRLMRSRAKQPRENRTITVDFQNEATYFQLLGDGKAFLEFVFAFLLSMGFQHTHKTTCHGGGCLTRHSHYVRVRLGGVTIWRIQCTTCKAVFTVLPHFVLRYRQMRSDVARNALLAMHGGLSLELCAVIYHISPMALYRLVCALGSQSLVRVLTRCGLPLPRYFLVDEKHSRCLTDQVYLPTIVSGRVIWHLGYTEATTALAFTQSYQEFQRAASRQDPSYRVRGSSPMASMVRPVVCGRCSLGYASATACAMRSIGSRKNSRPSRLRSIGPCAHSSTPCGTERGSAKACVCLRWASGKINSLHSGSHHCTGIGVISGCLAVVLIMCGPHLKHVDSHDKIHISPNTTTGLARLQNSHS